MYAHRSMGISAMHLERIATVPAEMVNALYVNKGCLMRNVMMEILQTMMAEAALVKLKQDTIALMARMLGQPAFLSEEME